MTPDLQPKIDAYLASLRRALAGLPAEEVSEILLEIRGHILEKAEAAGQLTPERLRDILRALGSPEEIAPLYHAEALVSRARASVSPVLLLRGAQRWAMVSVAGFLTLLVGLAGYGSALCFLLGALLKPFLRNEIGLFLSPRSLVWGVASNESARELLGWWIVPVGLVLAAATTLATTKGLRAALRFARFRS